MTELTREPVRFGIFDWLDESGRPQGDTYEERLRMLELADRRGFYAYHLAEHHQTELSTVPSPNLFLSAAAQRTKRLRLGALSYILPMYSPLRLLEEICMLDQLSGGRVEFGLSRGSTGEHVENDPDRAREMYNEALEVILQGLSTGEIDFHGKYYSFDKQFTRLRPVQQPYPPLWYPTSNLESIPWIAAKGINTAFSVHLAPDFGRIVNFVQRYWSEYAAHGAHGQPVPKVGFSVHIHVAETDAQAQAQAGPAFDLYQHNFTYRYVRRGNVQRYQARGKFEEELAAGRIVVGSPATVRDRLVDFLSRSGANYVIGCFAFGSLSGDQILSSVDLFATEVMPALAHVQEVSAA
jgi:alkanesulfonate monooxygenase SsuD/methylene tetrahydromethanopterin reductase-like flavin-dependent oxidoreductase (luciferase family)